VLEGLVYQLSYSLERHRFFNIRLRQWLILLCLILPTTMWLRSWGTSRLAAILVSLTALGVLVAMLWAERRRFIRFEQDSQVLADLVEKAQGNQPIADQQAGNSPLPAMKKIRVYTTGFFEVSGMRRYLVETPAYYVTFETREHCVMTQVPRTRFLLLGKSLEDEVGWWYIFFQPNMIRSLEWGCLYFGARPRSALRLEIAQSNASKNNPKAEILHMSFDDEQTHRLVLADLRYDAEGESLHLGD
jgi:hypothetical protein